jgi:large subunit ribosomal protein L3
MRCPVSQNKNRTLLGRKVGMTQMFLPDGTQVAVTVLEVGPCRVLQVKTPEKDGYSALQVGFGPKKKKAIKPLDGVFKKAGAPALSYVCEIPPLQGREIKLGDELKVDLFLDKKENENKEKVDVPVRAVDVVGISKGHGFSGTMRRWNFNSGPRAHGCKNVRERGSVGPGYVNRIFPGLKMPGHWGADRRKVQNLRVLRIDPETNAMLVKGAVPGPQGGFIIIQESSRKK